MARKREEIEGELPGGELTHNPFATLGPAGGERVPAPRAQAAEEGSPLAAHAPGPSSSKLVVRHESKGRGGKAVTCVTGLAPGAELEALARAASRALGAGARAVEGELLVQGRQVERVAAWLEGRGFTRVVRGN
jgi:translation initiation factor 1